MTTQMAVSKMYRVTAHREGRWWVFEIPELGTGGQTRTLDEVAQEAQRVAAMWLDVPSETVTVAVVTEGADDASGAHLSVGANSMES